MGKIKDLILQERIMFTIIAIVLGIGSILFFVIKNDIYQDEQTEKLKKAVENKEIGQVRKLLKDGAKIPEPDIFGETLLMEACKNGSFKISKILIEAGDDINARDIHNQNVLFYVLEYKYSKDQVNDMTRFLITKGIDVKIVTKKLKMTPLHTSILYQQEPIEVAKLLIDAGVNTNAKDHEGKTALMYAADYMFTY